MNDTAGLTAMPTIETDNSVSTSQPEATSAAQEARIASLERALEYLLIGDLNARCVDAIGPESNARLVETFTRLLLAVQPKYFFEVGAHDASTSRRVKTLLPTCEMWAFEANPEIYSHYLPAVAASGIRYVNLAITRTSGRVAIYTPQVSSKILVEGEVVSSMYHEPANTGRTSMLQRNEDATYKQFSVEGVSLNDFTMLRSIAGPERDIALWVDVEGAAYEVLAGAGDALKKAAVLFVESENYPFWTGQKQCAEVARLLLEAGFIPLQRDREYGDKQFNTIFLHHSLLHLVYPEAYMLGAATRRTGDSVLSAQSSAPARTQRKSYRSLTGHLHADMPVIVPVFNNPTYAANMLSQLVERGFRNVCIVDNASTLPEMRRFLASAERDATVIHQNANYGPRHVIEHRPIYDFLPDMFCVTDPDLEFNPNMPEDFIAELAWMSNHLKIGKAGLALRIDDADKMHDGRFVIQGREYHPVEWERQWWQDKVGHTHDYSDVYRAVTDTTFALYNKKYFTPHLFFDSIRVAGSFTCRHLPWYKQNGLGAEEEKFYRATQKWSYHLAESGNASQR